MASSARGVNDTPMSTFWMRLSSMITPVESNSRMTPLSGWSFRVGWPTTLSWIQALNA